MKIEICSKCACDTFRIKSQSVNGGYTANKICVRCGNETEIIDTYDDNN